MHRRTLGPARGQTALARGSYHRKTIIPESVTDAEVADFARQAKAKNTRRAYRSDFGVFATWCADAGIEPLPTSQEMLARYITARAKAGASMATVARGMVAIRQANRAQGYEPPKGLLLESTWSGLVENFGRRPRKVAALSSRQIKAMVDTLDTRRLRDVRNRALILVGYACGLRRSELVAITPEDLQWVRDTSKPGIILHLPRSKTDKTRVGQFTAISYVPGAYCPARALEAWLLVSGIGKGPPTAPVFVAVRGRRLLASKRLDPGEVPRIINRLLRRAGVAEDGAVYGGHSLRAGMVTEAKRNGAAEDDIQAQSRHTNVKQLRAYNQATILERSIVPYLGL